MNGTIENWLTTLESEGQVVIGSLSEIFSLFSIEEYADLFPAALLELTAYPVTEITVEYADDEATVTGYVFIVETSGTVQVVDQVYQLTEPCIHIAISSPESTECTFASYISATMGNLVNGTSLPVAIVNNELEIEDYGAEEDEEETVIWKIEYLENEYGEAINFSYLIQYLHTQDMEGSVPEQYRPVDDKKVTELQLLVSLTDGIIDEISYLLDYGQWDIFTDSSLFLDQVSLNITIDVLNSDNGSSCFLKGMLCADTLQLPEVQVIFSDDDTDTLFVQMLDEKYSIGEMNVLQPLVGDIDFSQVLPSGLQQLTDVTLTSFAAEIDLESIGLNSLSLVVQPTADEEKKWDIVPGVLSMQNVSLGYEFEPECICLRGTVVLPDTDIPMMVTYEISEEEGLPSTLTCELDEIAAIQGVTINIGDLSVLGFTPADLLPGLELLSFEMTAFEMDFAISDSITLTSFNFTIQQTGVWNIVYLVNMSNFSLDFNYTFATGEDETDTWLAVVTGEMLLGMDGMDPLPVQLTIPDQGDWCLELAGEDEEGVALPGLQAVASFVGVSVDHLVPDALDFDSIRLLDLTLFFPHPSDMSLTSMYVSVQKETVWNIADVFSLTDLQLNLDVDYTGTAPVIEGGIAGTLTAGDLVLPVLVPLPFNEQEWTIQLYDPAQLPSLSYFSGLAGFDANSLLQEFTGFSGIPEIIVTRFDIKFDTGPYKTRKLAVAADFSISVSITLPPGLQVRLDSVLFEMDDTGGDPALQNFVAYGAVVETMGDTTTLPVQLTRTASTWEMSINTEEGKAITVNGECISSIMPGLSLPSSLNDTGFDITGIRAVFTHDMELTGFSVYTTITDPNSIFGLDIFIDAIPIRIIYDNSEAEGRWGIQVLEWPFKTGGFQYLQKEGWILLDLWEFGAVKLELPTFYPVGDNFVLNGAFETTHDGEEVILQNGDIFEGKDLNIPIHALFDKMGLSFLNTFFPESLPLTPSVDLRETIRDLQGNPDNLPDAMQDYLDIEVPDSAEFDVFISSTGDVSFNVKIYQEEVDLSKPVKLILPAGLFIVGIKVYSVGFTYIKGVPFFTLDAESDLFLTLLLIALTWFDIDEIPPLPNFKKVHTKLSLRDVWFLLATGFPLPLFYDELSIHYFGVEGINAGSEINFPKPMPSLYDLSVIGTMIEQLAQFFSDADYFLDEDTFTFGGAELEFTMGPQYIELPEYVGDPTIGTKDNIFTVDASDVFCAVLNTLKDPSLSRLIRLIPEEYRFLDHDISFGPMSLQMAVGITTPLEFYTDNPAGFSYSLMDYLFPDLALESINTAGDSDTGLPKPRHFLDFNDSSSNGIVDRITGIQLLADDSKQINWQKSDIKAYKDKAYIQSIEDADYTSVITGDVIDESYPQFTITFLTNLSSLADGCLLYSSSNFGVWFYDGSFEACGGAKDTAASVAADTWVRVTLVQTDTLQSLYIDRNPVGQKEITQELGTGRVLIGSLNEDVSFDLPVSEGVFQGGYTDIAIYDRALSGAHVSRLCDLDDGLVDNNTPEDDGRILALLAGNWEIGSLVSSQLMLGMSMKGLTAAGLHVAANGSLGDNLLGFDFKGVCQVDAENKSVPFFIGLSGGFYLLGKEIVACSVEFCKEYFEFKGTLDLFDWPFLTVQGDVEGRLQSDGQLLLTANGEITLAGITIVDTTTTITNSGINMQTELLGLEIGFDSSIKYDNLYMEGSVKFDHTYDLSVPGFTISTPLGNVEIPGIDVGDFGIDIGFMVKISSSGLEAEATAGFTLFSHSWSVTLKLPGIPTSLSELKAALVELIEDYILANLMSIPEALSMFIEWAQELWSELVDFAERVAHVLKEVFSKTYDEIGDILSDTFECTYEEVANGLKFVGATANEIGSILTDIGCTTVDTVLDAVGYAEDAIDEVLDFLKCPTDGWSICCVKICCVKW